MKAHDLNPTQEFLSPHRRNHPSITPAASLEAYRKRMQSLLNSLGEGLIATDERGQITMINAYALESLRYAEQELLGTWMPDSITAVDEQSHPIISASRPVMRALTRGDTIAERVYYLRKDGSAMPVFLTVSPVMVDDTPAGAIEIFRDLTSEQQLNVAKEEFVSLASHQLRTPATAVKSILAMLAAGDFGSLTTKQQKYLDQAIKANDREHYIIDSLLNAALVDTGRMELDLDRIDLSALLRETISDHLNAATARGQTIDVTTPPHCMLMVDAAKIRMVIDNLVSNASKYSDNGKQITVELSKRTNSIALTVKDQGVGIPQEAIDKLFTKFSRIDNDLSASVGGTGLGLFLAHHIVELHRGSITVRSQMGVGSSFEVRLPTDRSAMEQ